MGEHAVAVLQFDREHRVGERFDHRPFDFDRVLLGHRLTCVPFSRTVSAQGGPTHERVAYQKSPSPANSAAIRRCPHANLGPMASAELRNLGPMASAELRNLGPMASAELRNLGPMASAELRLGVLGRMARRGVASVLGAREAVKRRGWPFRPLSR